MWGKLKLLRPHRASCGQARAGDGATAGFHSGKSYDQSCASGREQCANKDLKQHGSDRYKEGPKWKKSRVLSPSGHSLCSQIHALTAKQNLKAKTTQPHNHSFFIFFGCTVWLVAKKREKNILLNILLSFLETRTRPGVFTCRQCCQTPGPQGRRQEERHLNA